MLARSKAKTRSKFFVGYWTGARTGTTLQLRYINHRTGEVDRLEGEVHHACQMLLMCFMKVKYNGLPVYTPEN